MSDKVFVISAPEHHSLAKELLTGVDDIQISFGRNVSAGENFSEAIGREIEEADIFLTIIDKKFPENANLFQELGAVIKAIVKSAKKEKLLIAILMDIKEVPDDPDPEYMRRILYDTKSANSKMNAILRTRLEIAFWRKNTALKKSEKKTNSENIEETIVSRKEEKSEDGSVEIKEELDALEYMKLNLKNINNYYKWSQRQAKSAFWLAVAICAAGFALLVVAIILAANSSVSAAVITAVSGGVTELTAGTVLVIYRKSLAQLNHYHKALHEDERFLSSINLLDRFSTKELQDQMLQEIIRSEIRMNIAEAGWEEDEKSDKTEKKEKKDDGGSH